jgi:hypothetical protein
VADFDGMIVRPSRLCALTVLVVGTIAGCDAFRASKADRIHRYDVVTALDTFTFESASGCSALYCSQYRVNTDGRLSGSFGVAASLLESRSATATGSFSGMFCSSTSYDVPSGCAAVQPVAREYPLGIARVTYSAAGAPDSLVVELRDVENTSPHLTLRGRFHGDSVVGRVYWALVSARHPPGYWGSFIARPR